MKIHILVNLMLQSETYKLLFSLMMLGFEYKISIGSITLP